MVESVPADEDEGKVEGEDKGDGGATGDAGKVQTDTEFHEPPTGTGDVDRTEHAPLAQWASRAGGRPYPGDDAPDLQEPIDPWPVPIQGLVPPPGAPAIEDLGPLDYPKPAPARNVRVLVTVLAVAVTALAAGAVGVVARSWSDNEKPDPVTAVAARESAGVVRSGGVLPSGAVPDPNELEPVPTGPVPQGVPPENVYSMDEICKGQTYWPMLPKRTGKGPHPVLVYGDTGGSRDRLPYTMFKAWFLKSKTTELVWTSDKAPSKIQLVACVDRVASGKKVRTCTYKSPQSGTGTLYHATYRLHVLETATGRTVLDVKIEAKDTTCPYVLDVPDDKKLYMEPDAAMLVSRLHKLAGV